VNTRLLLKLGVVLLVLFFMLMLGMSNNIPVRLKLVPLRYESDPIPSAIMFFLFFAGGVITGSILTVGGGKPSSAPKSKG